MALNTTKNKPTRKSKLSLKLNYNSSSEDVRIVLAILNLNQESLAEPLEVTPASISRAINKDPLLKVLRKKIIDYLNVLQFGRMI